MIRRCLVLMCAFAVLTPAMAYAATSVAVLDVQALLTESQAAKSIEKQADERKDKFLAELSKQEQELRDTEKKLSEERASLSKEEFAKTAKEFEEKLMATRQMAQSTKKIYDEATAKALKQLRDKIYEIAQSIASEKGYNLVISKQSVIVGAQDMDITEESMKRLNESISSVTLDIKDK